MAFIGTVSDDQAAPEGAELLEQHRAALGYVPNYARLFAQRPGVYKAWQQLKDAIAAEMDPRRYELVTLAAAARCFFSKAVDAAGVESDARFIDLQPELREALTVGRPISGVQDD